MNSRFWLGLGCLLWTLACSKAPAPPGPAAPDQDPSVTLRLWNRGVLELDRHEFVAAQKTFAEVVSRLPEDPDARINYGIACMNQVRPELFREAEVAYTEALRLDPSSLPGHHCLGVLLKHLGRGAEATPHFEAVLAKDPHDPTANYYLATLKAAAGDRMEAEKLLRRALASEPHQSSALLQLFRILQRSDRAAEGETLLATFEAFEKAETGNKAGIVYHEMGHYGEAIRQPRLRAPAAPTPPVPLELPTAHTLPVPTVAENEAFGGGEIGGSHTQVIDIFTPPGHSPRQALTRPAVIPVAHPPHPRPCPSNSRRPSGGSGRPAPLTLPNRRR